MCQWLSGDLLQGPADLILRVSECHRVLLEKETSYNQSSEEKGVTPGSSQRDAFKIHKPGNFSEHKTTNTPWINLWRSNHFNSQSNNVCHEYVVMLPKLCQQKLKKTQHRKKSMARLYSNAQLISPLVLNISFLHDRVSREMFCLDKRKSFSPTGLKILLFSFCFISFPSLDLIDG